MRPNPGSILWLLLLPLMLMAGHRWEAGIATHEAVVSEAVKVDYLCTFDDAAYGTSIEIALPKEDADFRYAIYKESEHIVDGKRENRYSFLLFPRRAGSFNIAITALFKKTSRAQVENAVIGRDNMEYYQFDKTEELLPELTLHVTESGADLVGEFALHVSHSKTQVAPFEPFHITYELRGVGNLDAFEPIALHVKGAELFFEQPQRDYALNRHGYEGQIVQKFAVVTDTNVSIPAITLRYFDTGSRTLKTLHHDALHVNVALPYTKEELLDADEDAEDSEDSGTLFFYFLTLLSGVVLGWYLHRYWLERTKTVATPQRFTSAKTLLCDLALQGGYEEIIDRAEHEGWSVSRIQNACKKHAQR